ncbi:MAG: DUF2723 domain-containing protein [candidate division Zixibacteria bacterium]|nr:DUF2723 domain-containing protein [candidate division Zixibacteria bacterium]
MTSSGKNIAVSRPVDRLNAILAAGVFLIAVLVYYLTKAPTFSFWDCGEFIACSYILGIPHPPGSPLYVLIGRVFSVLPIAGDIAVRINLFSVVSSAVAAMFTYLVTVRLIRFWFADHDRVYNRIIAYIGGFTGALFMAFSDTNWSNAVEAEVYAPSMLIMMAIYWLTLKYYDMRETTTGSKFMLVALYLGMLGVGIHLTLYVVVPILGLYFILKREAGTREWGILSLYFIVELYLIFLLSARPGEVPYYLTFIVALIAFLFHCVYIQQFASPIKIALGLYVITLFPFYFTVVNAVAINLTGRSSAFAQTMQTLPVGWLGFAGLSVWGLYALYRRFTSDDTQQHAIWLMTGLYCLGPVALYGIGEVFSGYGAFLGLSALGLIGVVVLLWRYINWLVLVGLGAMSMIILGFWQFTIGMSIGAVLLIVLGIVLRDRNWKTAVTIILLAAIGFSVHLFIPIRSAHSPSIDENNPSESFSAFVGYLERKQYGQESMVERMFQRRAEWSNQFGDSPRMGFWHFFKDQYGLNGPKFFIPLILGLFGIWETIRRRAVIGLPLLAILLLCTAGLILYMNFADGTRQNPTTGLDYMEVRDRDYFFTPGFIIFGLAIGLGLAALMDLIRDTFRAFGPRVEKAAFGASTLLVLMPLFPLTQNYYYNDRSQNYIPFDYANNFLKSCRQDAILVTNGDNDTFPLWCIQEVYGIRKDVRIVNLSLANTGWYIKQLRDQHNVPISFTDSEIDRLFPYRTRDGRAFRIQDQLIDNIIVANRWKYPMQFAFTVPGNNRTFRGQSLDSNLVLEGMVYTLSPQQREYEMDFDRTRQLYMDDYVYRGVNDSSIYKDEATDRIVNNYVQGFLILADSLRRAGQYDEAMRYVEQSLELVPGSFDNYAYASQLLAEMGRLDTLMAFVNEAPTLRKKELFFNWAVSARISGRTGDAIEVLKIIRTRYPDYVEAFRQLGAMYYQLKRYSDLSELVDGWLAKHPEDYQTRMLRSDLDSIMAEFDSIWKDDQ